MQTFARSIPCFLYGVIITHTLGDYYAHQNPNTMVLYKVSSSTCMYVGHLIMILLAITQIPGLLHLSEKETPQRQPLPLQFLYPILVCYKIKEQEVYYDAMVFQ